MSHQQEDPGSIADEASANVARIIAAAEETAAEIVAAARANAEAIIERAQADARSQAERAEKALAGLAGQAGQLQGQMAPHPAEGLANPASETAKPAGPIEPEPAADTAGARLVAMKLALDGSAPEAISARIGAEFPEVEDPASLVADVLARAAR